MRVLPSYECGRIWRLSGGGGWDHREVHFSNLLSRLGAETCARCFLIDAGDVVLIVWESSERREHERGSIDAHFKQSSQG